MAGKSKRKSERELKPKLRFPEFKDAPGWNLSTFGEAATFYNGKAFSKEELLDRGKYKVLRVGNFFSSDHWYFSDLELESEKYCDTGDLLYAWSASFGPRIWHGGKTIFHYHIWKVVERPQIERVFLFIALDCETARMKSQSANGLGMLHLTKNGIENWKFSFPERAEQTKIAGCLSSLDELIGAESRKLEALQAHKKGLMQQLFPREGETLPRLRFPEFKDEPEWTSRTLGEFLVERNEFPKVAVPLFSLTIENGVTPKTERYERAFLVKDEAVAYKLVLPDDFAFNPMNLRFGAIGRHSGTENVAVSKYYNIFYCDTTVDARFCEFYFRSDQMIAFYDNMAIGSLIEKRRVHFNEFLKFDIRFPDLPEQRVIADSLTAHDDLISAQAQKIDSLKTHKTGLMQQLFPSLEDTDA
jgi:type I restriction enzyme S subunit